MGRSVSTPPNCEAVAYQHMDFEDEIDWEMFVEDIRFIATSLWPSLDETDEWVGREDHALLENQHCYIGVSEYCGLIAIWLQVKEDMNNDHPELSRHWCGQISKRFVETFGELRKVGTFSNGEAVFERIAA